MIATVTHLAARETLGIATGRDTLTP